MVSIIEFVTPKATINVNRSVGSIFMVKNNGTKRTIVFGCNAGIRPNKTTAIIPSTKNKRSSNIFKLSNKKINMFSSNDPKKMKEMLKKMNIDITEVQAEVVIRSEEHT